MVSLAQSRSPRHKEARINDRTPHWGPVWRTGDAPHGCLLRIPASTECRMHLGTPSPVFPHPFLSLLLLFPRHNCTLISTQELLLRFKELSAGPRPTGPSMRCRARIGFRHLRPDKSMHPYLKQPYHRHLIEICKKDADADRRGRADRSLPHGRCGGVQRP